MLVSKKVLRYETKWADLTCQALLARAADRSVSGD